MSEEQKKKEPLDRKARALLSEKAIKAYLASSRVGRQLSDTDDPFEGNLVNPHKRSKEN